jgi:tetratricopeptide (TPR) repeat protein
MSTPRVSVRRNDPCPCGSGQRYKACCGRLTSDSETVLVRDLGALVALLNAGQYAALEAEALKLLERRPESGSAWQLLAVALSKQGKDALHALAAAAQRLPDDAVAQLNLGNAMARLGRLDEAQPHFDRALAIRPEFAEAHNNLGDLMLQRGRFDEAALHCRRALEIRPDYAEAYHTLGNVLLKLARVDDAILSLQRAVAISADFAEAHVSLGHALRSIGRLDEAVAGYRAALRLKPDFVAAHIALGTALRLQRRGAESQASCDNALKIKPDSAAALAVLADLHADDGRFTEAEQLFQRIISIDPESGEALSGLARLRRMTPADAAWLAAAQRLAGQRLPPQRELPLRFAIGKYFDDVQDFESAFVNYRQANELAKRCGPRHDRERLSRTVDLIIRSHDQSWMNRLRGAASDSTRPVFIVGMLRSGTTLAEQILASHPQVFGAGELMFWGDFSATAVAGAAAADAPRLDISDVALSGASHDYVALLQRLSADAARVVDKFPTNFMLLGLIHAALPRARIIHMRRNPIDTCLSIYFQHFEAANTHANDLEDLAHYYREYRRLMRHWRAVLPAAQLLEVPYEGLVLDLTAWSRRMLDFVELPWDPRCLHFDQTSRTVVTASRWQVRQKISTSSVERWRNYERFVGPLKPLLEPAARG